MEYLCVNHIFPGYHIWSQFTTASHMAAIQLDALQISHPVEVVVMRLCEFDETFDYISCHKEPAIIKMLYKYRGDDCFRRGMEQICLQECCHRGFRGLPRVSELKTRPQAHV